MKSSSAGKDDSRQVERRRGDSRYLDTGARITVPWPSSRSQRFGFHSGQILRHQQRRVYELSPICYLLELTAIHSISKVLAINRKTGIQSRSTVLDIKEGFAVQPKAPTVVGLDDNFRRVGVNLAIQACEKAMKEAGLQPEGITHTVAVTCTNQGNPGYDLLVHEKLGL